MEMQLDSISNINENISYLENMDTLNVLQNFLNALGTPIKKEDFIQELESYNQSKIKELSNLFNQYTKNITRNKINDCVTYITVRVKKTNSDGTIDVFKPNENSDLNCWENIPNPTIFKYLIEGDEVVLGCTRRNQKSNCWVEYAKLDQEEFLKKTIFYDINKVFDIGDNISLLKKWIVQIGGGES